MTCLLERLSGTGGNVVVLQHICCVWVREIKLLCCSISVWSCCYTWNYTKICDGHGIVNSQVLLSFLVASLPFIRIHFQKYEVRKQVVVLKCGFCNSYGVRRMIFL